MFMFAESNNKKCNTIINECVLYIFHTNIFLTFADSFSSGSMSNNPWPRARNSDCREKYFSHRNDLNWERSDNHDISYEHAA